jgi:hypothetical protein
MYSLYHQLKQQEDIAESWLQIKMDWQYSLLLIVLLLMLLNWFWEALKWKFLLKSVQQLSFFDAYKSVLAGTTISLITPNRVGEFGGRILYVEDNNKSKAVALSMYAGLIQLWITLLLGIVGLLFMRNETAFQQSNGTFKSLFSSSPLLLISFVAAVLLAAVIFRFHFFLKILMRFKWVERRLSFLNILESIETKEMLRIQLLSLFRYFTFILQYWLMLKLMNVDIQPMQSFCLTAVFYLLMAIAPTIGLLELPVRASAGVVIFGFFSDNVLGIQLAVFGIWLINLVLPAIAGSLFMMKKKLFK